MTHANSTALIGSTGFVGGNLDAQYQFSHRYRSTNIEQIRGKAFSLVVCAGAPGKKWYANQHPDEDRGSIDLLISCLKCVEAERFVLISTVDVFSEPLGVDECSDPTRRAQHSYGQHRYLLEQVCQELFPNIVVVRLPGLFGPGLRKNALFDFLSGNNVDRIDSRGVFQWYNTERLWSDIERASAANISLVHLATEPCSIATLHEEVFGAPFTNVTAGEPARYDMRSRFSTHWNSRGDGYQYAVDEVFEDMRKFVARAKQGEMERSR
ncbi:MAG: hypothetical protein KDD44_06990 [Bdellovibrionales bacterium]|nr:hypothetical protein [Bdellovibrionales bacterium]